MLRIHVIVFFKYDYMVKVRMRCHNLTESLNASNLKGADPYAVYGTDIPRIIPGSKQFWKSFGLDRVPVKAGLQEPEMEPGKDHHRFFSLSFPPVPPDTHSLPCAPPDMPSAPPDIHCLPPAPPDTYSFLLHLQTPIVCLLHLLLPPAPLSTACLLHLQILLASCASRYPIRSLDLS